MLKYNWTFDEAKALYDQPFIDLVLQAQQAYRACFPANTIQVSALENIKIGGCPEDCAWCSQSVHHHTGVQRQPLASLESVIKAATAAKKSGATRFCLAAAWRGPTNRQLDTVIEMIKAIKAMGLETCITLGKLTPAQAEALKAAGLDYYNHNLESSENHFKKMTTTRTYEDRLTTLEYVRQVGMKVCSGGILGMGETEKDRIDLLLTLANQPAHPQSVSINLLVPIAGTPLENTPPLDDLSIVRCIALARILMPGSYLRIAGGRRTMSIPTQTLCFIAGVNAIHHCPTMLTTPNADMSEDKQLLHALGMRSETKYEAHIE